MQVEHFPAAGPLRLDPTLQRDVWERRHKHLISSLLLAISHELSDGTEKLSGPDGPNRLAKKTRTG